MWEVPQFKLISPPENMGYIPEMWINLLRYQLYLGIEVGGWHGSYSMIRGGLSKPSTEGLPKTVSGWCALEYIDKRTTTETEQEMEPQLMNE